MAKKQVRRHRPRAAKRGEQAEIRNRPAYLTAPDLSLLEAAHWAREDVQAEPLPLPFARAVTLLEERIEQAIKNKAELPGNELLEVMLSFQRLAVRNRQSQYEYLANLMQAETERRGIELQLAAEREAGQRRHPADYGDGPAPSATRDG